MINRLLLLYSDSNRLITTGYGWMVTARSPAAPRPTMGQLTAAC